MILVFVWSIKASVFIHINHYIFSAGIAPFWSHCLHCSIKRVKFEQVKLQANSKVCSITRKASPVLCESAHCEKNVWWFSKNFCLPETRSEMSIYFLVANKQFNDCHSSSTVSQILIEWNSNNQLFAQVDLDVRITSCTYARKQEWETKWEKFGIEESQKIARFLQKTKLVQACTLRTEIYWSDVCFLSQFPFQLFIN